MFRILNIVLKFRMFNYFLKSVCRVSHGCLTLWLLTFPSPSPLYTMSERALYTLYIVSKVPYWSNLDSALLRALPGVCWDHAQGKGAGSDLLGAARSRRGHGRRAGPFDRAWTKSGPQKKLSGHHIASKCVSPTLYGV